MEYLPDYIKNKKDIRPLILQLVEAGSKPNDIICFLVNLFCQNYLSQYIEHLDCVVSILKSFEAQKASGKVASMLDLCAFLAGLTPHDPPAFPKILDVNEDLYKLVFTHVLEHDALLAYKEVLDDCHYRLLNVLYDQIEMGTDWKTNVQIASLILHAKLPAKLAGGDILFGLLLDCAKDKEAKYVVACKDLYYYRSSKKVRFERMHLIFCSIVLCTMRNCVDYEKPATEEAAEEDDENGPYVYLYQVFEFDKIMIEQVNEDKKNNTNKVQNMFLTIE